MSRFFVVDLIADEAPAAPACFDSQQNWREWLVAAHEAGESVVRRVDVRIKGKRQTRFAVLPVERIDICRDCTEARRDRMAAQGRCHPPMIVGLVRALAAGDRRQVTQAITGRELDADALLLLADALRADQRRQSQAAAARRRNDAARHHIVAAWRTHQSEVAAGTAEPLSRQAFASLMIASMARDPRFSSRNGTPFTATVRHVTERWLPQPHKAGIEYAKPALCIPSKCRPDMAEQE